MLQLRSGHSISTCVMGKFTILILSVFVFFAFVFGVSAQSSPDEPFPPEIESCLRAVFGDDRFEAFVSGQAEITAEEMSQAEQCYDSYYGSSPVFTPPPEPEYPPPGEYFPPQALCFM